MQGRGIQVAPAARRGESETGACDAASGTELYPDSSGRRPGSSALSWFCSCPGGGARELDPGLRRDNGGMGMAIRVWSRLRCGGAKNSMMLIGLPGATDQRNVAGSRLSPGRRWGGYGVLSVGWRPFPAIASASAIAAVVASISPRPSRFANARRLHSVAMSAPRSRRIAVSRSPRRGRAAPQPPSGVARLRGRRRSGRPPHVRSRHGVSSRSTPCRRVCRHCRRPGRRCR